MDTTKLYHDINIRCDGEIYIGVVGPVRSGKSTFIKRFMDLLVLPEINDEYKLSRITDELPQSCGGKTIMTTEPKFIPKEAAQINLCEDTKVKIRLIDCVGFMTANAGGHMEDNKERMVKTPWFDYEIPFTKAASIGTKKVICDHSAIGIVITSDGSFGEFERNDYLEAESLTINELKKYKKPFVVLLNSAKPNSSSAIECAGEISKKHDVTVIPVNCSTLKHDELISILEKCLYEFPVTCINFRIPKWISMLDINHPIRSEILLYIKKSIQNLKRMSSLSDASFPNECEYISSVKITNRDYSCGECTVFIQIENSYYYDTLSSLSHLPIANEYDLVKALKEMAELKTGYEKLKHAFSDVQLKGYGVVMPDRDEITLYEPVIIKNGSKYGVKIKAEAPSIHMIRANVLTEIAPIVGSEAQAKDLIDFISQNASENGIWDVNIFGKSISQIVNDGIRNKIEKMTATTQDKMQETLQKITNDSNGSVICIIL